MKFRLISLPQIKCGKNIIAVVYNIFNMADVPKWLDGANPPSYKEKGSFWSKVVGFFHPETQINEIEEIIKMPGVETAVVRKNGKKVIQITVNGMTLPEE